MFLNLYKTRLKCLCKNYENIFWSFGFPIILAIFFYMGFYNLSSDNNIDTIPIAVVAENSTSKDFLSNMKAVKTAKDKDLFEVQLCDIETAKTLLNNSKVDGYIIYGEKPTLYVKKNGIEQTIIKSYINNYEQLKLTAGTITAMKPNTDKNVLHQELTSYQDYVIDEGKKNRKPDYFLISYYSLIALTCVFGTNWGFRELIDIQADQSAIGARISAAPVHKLKLLFCNLSAAFTLHFISVLILLAFLNNILGIDFGGSLWKILLTCFLGSLCGITLGAMVCVTVKANVKVREAILNMVVVGGGFLSGMMIVDMKYLIATQAPVIGYLNPSNLITDALYSLYYYDGYGRFFLNIGMLTTLTIIFALVTFSKIRRKVYASI